MANASANDNPLSSSTSVKLLAVRGSSDGWPAEVLGWACPAVPTVPSVLALGAADSVRLASGAGAGVVFCAIARGRSESAVVTLAAVVEVALAAVVVVALSA